MSDDFPLARDADGRYMLANVVSCFECGGSYRIRATHEVSAEHRAWLIEETNRPAQLEIIEPTAIVDEPTQPFPKDPAKIPLEFGSVTKCPRCHGMRRGPRYNRKNELIPGDLLCMDPDNKLKPCKKCRGFGVVRISHDG